MRCGVGCRCSLDPELLWLWLQLQLRFSPWPGNFHMPQVWPYKKRKRLGLKPCGPESLDLKGGSAQVKVELKKVLNGVKQTQAANSERERDGATPRRRT